MVGGGLVLGTYRYFRLFEESMLDEMVIFGTNDKSNKGYVG